MSLPAGEFLEAIRARAGAREMLPGRRLASAKAREESRHNDGD